MSLWSRFCSQSHPFLKLHKEASLWDNVYVCPVSVFHCPRYRDFVRVLEAWKSLPHCSWGCLRKLEPYPVWPFGSVFKVRYVVTSVTGWTRLHVWLCHWLVNHWIISVCCEQCCCGHLLTHTLWMRAIVSLGHLPKSGIPRSHCDSMFSIWRDCQTASCGSCIVKPQPRSTRFLFRPYPYLPSSLFLIVRLLVGGSIYLFAHYFKFFESFILYV